jgi:cellulose synthase/poly-beta-1,6-N-acetylglucosamine synthase-like glycosyltransferase
MASVAPPKHRTAIVIACKNGEATIGATVRSALGQGDIFVISDGSTDRTGEEAQAAGATVLTRAHSGGKPDALRAASAELELAENYEFVAVLDDDTILADDYVALLTEKLDSDDRIAVASGRIDSLWNHPQRWNPFIAMRAFMYWSYQVTIKRGQNALRIVNVICGANSSFRAPVFAELVKLDAPYAIDDMFWLAEIARQRLGRVAYVHAARSWTIDPHTFRDWYRQTVRWSWGQFQSVRGHRLGLPVRRDRGSRLGLRFSWFDFGYLALLIDWLPYMIEPFVFVPVAYFLRAWVNPLWFLLAYLATSILWILVGAIALRKPRLALLAPVIMVLDLVYRVTMLHALVKTVLHPRVDVCRWDSPERFQVIAATAATAAIAPARRPLQPLTNEKRGTS